MAFLTAAMALGGAALSSRSARKAANKASDASEMASRAIQDAGRQAREDVLDLTPRARKELGLGTSRAFNLFNKGIGAQQKALSQGNLNAQQTVSGGFDQQRNALLGLPVDTQGFAPQGIGFTKQFYNPWVSYGAMGERQDRDAALLRRDFDDIYRQEDIVPPMLRGSDNPWGIGGIGGGFT